MNLLSKILIAAIIFVNNLTFAQNEFINHKKYWYYKTRLNNDFLKIGLGSGESMPANERQFTNGPQFDHNSWKTKWGDASARLGLYLAVLATEYKLLKNSNQDLTRIKHEIFCALNAINRIDFNAEILCGQAVGNNASGSLNGFFVRDDVPSEKEVKENGIITADMDATLLQKIEELYIHVVQLNKKVEVLEKENAFLKNK